MHTLQRFFATSILCVVATVMCGCGVDSPTSLVFNSPRCTIIEQTEIHIPSFGFPTMDITVKNNGDGPTAYDIGCYIKLKKGNHVVDEGGASFGTLYDRESKTERALFTKLRNASDYTTMEVTLYWYDANEHYYSTKK